MHKFEDEISLLICLTSAPGALFSIFVLFIIFCFGISLGYWDIVL
jgi:UPF0716 family protein affecting phage T7 exclusion